MLLDYPYKTNTTVVALSGAKNVPGTILVCNIRRKILIVLNTRLSLMVYIIEFERFFVSTGVRRQKCE